MTGAAVPAAVDGWSATLTLPDYGKFARYPGAIPKGSR